MLASQAADSRGHSTPSCVLAAALLKLPMGILLMIKAAYFSQLLQMIPLLKSMRPGEEFALPSMRVSRHSHHGAVLTSWRTNMIPARNCTYVHAPASHSPTS
jgi:hypothetical protein